MTFENWSRTLETAFGTSSDMLPAILASLAILLLGVALAYLSRLVAKRVLGRIAARFDLSFERGGAIRASRLMRATPKVVGGIVFWAVLLFFAAAALEGLSLPVVTELLQDIVYFLPRVLLAVVVVLIGFVGADVARSWISDLTLRAGSEHSQVLGRLAQGSIIVVALTIGAEHLGLEGQIFNSLLTVILASTLGGMALAFGLGSGPVVTNILASYYASKTLAIGDEVRVSNVEGIIREIGPTSILIEADGNRIYLPAKKYCDEICVVVGRDR